MLHSPSHNPQPVMQPQPQTADPMDINIVQSSCYHYSTCNKHLRLIFASVNVWLEKGPAKKCGYRRHLGQNSPRNSGCRATGWTGCGTGPPGTGHAPHYTMHPPPQQSSCSPRPCSRHIHCRCGPRGSCPPRFGQQQQAWHPRTKQGHHAWHGTCKTHTSTPTPMSISKV